MWGKIHQQDITEQTHVYHITVVSLHYPSLYSQSPITVFKHIPVIWSTVLKLNCQNNPLRCSAPDVPVYDKGRKKGCRSTKVWTWLRCKADIVCLCVCVYMCIGCKRAGGQTSMGWFSVSPPLLHPTRASPSLQRAGKKQARQSLSHAQMQAQKNQNKKTPHLRSRLASFQSRSINFKIWRVNMSCLRSRKGE